MASVGRNVGTYGDTFVVIVIIINMNDRDYTNISVFPF